MKTTEFILRFLMHVLPPEFVKISHYGSKNLQ
ncbi:transposase [Oceanobacillus saliphilus]